MPYLSTTATTSTVLPLVFVPLAFDPVYVVHSDSSLYFRRCRFLIEADCGHERPGVFLPLMLPAEGGPSCSVLFGRITGSVDISDSRGKRQLKSIAEPGFMNCQIFLHKDVF